MKLHTSLCAISILMGLAVPAIAQEDYPARPIELIVAFGAGGTTDIGARVLASIAEAELGQSIVVQNRTGAGGQIGWTELATSRTDGYTIGYVNLPNLSAIIADPERQAAFTGESFTPIVNHIVDPGVIWVRADSPYQTLEDVVAAAKATPDEIRAGTTGILGDDHLAILKLQEAAPGASFRVVHLQDSAAQLKEVLAGNIDVGFDNVGGLKQYIESGEIRALAVTDDEPSQFLPEVPTSGDAGYPTVLSSSSRGIVGPAGLDPAIVARLEEVLLKAMADPEHVTKIEEAGFTVAPMPADEFAAHLEAINAETKTLVDLARAQQ